MCSPAQEVSDSWAGVKPPPPTTAFLLCVAGTEGDALAPNSLSFSCGVKLQENVYIILFLYLSVILEKPLARSLQNINTDITTFVSESWLLALHCKQQVLNKMLVGLNKMQCTGTRCQVNEDEKFKQTYLNGIIFL